MGPNNFIFRMPEECPVLLESSCDSSSRWTADEVKEVCSNSGAQVIKVLWDLPSEPLFLKITEQDLLSMGTVNTEGKGLKLEWAIRVSLVRNVLTGRFYSQAFYFC